MKIILQLILILIFALSANAQTILVGSDGSDYAQTNPQCWSFPAMTLENCNWKTSRYLAKNTGTISFFRVRVGSTPTGCTNDSGCWAIYEGGTSNSVGALKAYRCFTGYNWTTIGVGWHDFPVQTTVTNLTVTQGQYYWLVFHSYAVDGAHYATAGCSAYIGAYRGTNNGNCAEVAGLDLNANYAGRVEQQCTYSTPPAPNTYDVGVQTYVMWGVWGGSGPQTPPAPPTSLRIFQ